MEVFCLRVLDIEIRYRFNTQKKGECKMKKFYVVLLTFLFCLIGNIMVFAAPDTVAADAVGDTHDLVVVTSPQNQKDSTFSSDYIISGYGREGTDVTFYWHDSAENLYKKIYNEVEYVDENGVKQKTNIEANVTVGASGLFMNTIVLAPGGNNLLVRAENGEKVQLMRLSVTKYNYNLFDIIKSLTN